MTAIDMSALVGMGQTGHWEGDWSCQDGMGHARMGHARMGCARMGKGRKRMVWAMMGKGRWGMG